MSKFVKGDVSRASAAMFVQALAEDMGLEVKFGGNTPGYSRPQNLVVLPNYPVFTPEQLKLEANANTQCVVNDLYAATGLHETGHPLYTDDGPRFTEEIGKFLWNALEDIRVDTLQQRRLAGARRIFEEGYGRLIKMGYWKAPQSGDFLGAFAMWVLCHGRSTFCGQITFAEIGNAANAEVRSLIGDQLADEAWSLISKVASAKSTQDVYNITLKVLDWLKRLQQPQPEQSQQNEKSDDSSSDGQSGDSSQPQDGSSDSDSSHSGSSGAQKDQQSGDTTSSETGSSDQSQGGQTSGSPQDGSQSCESGSAPAEAGQGQPVPVAPDPQAVAKAATSVLNASGMELPGQVGEAASDALDSATSQAFGAGADKVLFAGRQRAKADNFLYRGDGDVRPMAMRLRRLLEARSRDECTYDRVGDRLDSSLLHRVPLGERDVFVDEIEVRKADTFVHVLIDASSSMRSNQRIEKARSAALRMCIALGEIPGVTPSASAFPYHVNGSSDGVLELLPPGKKARQHARAFLELSAEISSTPLAHALTDAEFLMGRRRESRRILFVLTDGAPNGGPESSRKVIRRMKAAGMEVYGLGIEVMQSSNLFDKFVIVQSVRDLERHMFQLLKQTLLKHAA